MNTLQLLLAWLAFNTQGQHKQTLLRVDIFWQKNDCLEHTEHMDGYQRRGLCFRTVLRIFFNFYRRETAVGIHSNRRESVQTTADALRKVASYKHFRVTFQTYRRRAFGIQNIFFRVQYSFKAQCCEWQDKMAPAPIWRTCLPLACASLFWPPCSQWYLRWTSHCTRVHPGLQHLSWCLLRLSLLADYEESTT